MGECGVLFLPSGPGLNSGPANAFLGPLFRACGQTLFWNEPSAQRGDSLPSDDGALWDAIGKSLESAAGLFPGRFMIVTESFGSILAEALYLRLGSEARARVAGILHTPPVLDLYSAFRKTLNYGLADFTPDGDGDRAARMKANIAELDLRPHLGAPALHRGITLAFESPGLLPRYFRSPEALRRWGAGFAAAGFTPEPEMRTRILRGMSERGAPTRTTFAPDVPTWVAGGGSDPYQTIEEFESAILEANAKGRRHPIEWRAFPEAGHYPYVDAFERWESDVWLPFRNAIAVD